MRRAILTIAMLSACTTAPVTRPAPPAPWVANAPVPAPPVLIDEWRKAENRATCAPVTIADGGDRARGGTPRRANFSGGWAVAWDVPGLPGREPSGHECATCGRGVYGIAGAGVTWGSDWPNVGFEHRIDWADGHFAGYGLEGGSGPNWLAQIRIPDQTCVYYVWSFLGREHLEHLIGQVRRASAQSSGGGSPLPVPRATLRGRA